MSEILSEYTLTSGTKIVLAEPEIATSEQAWGLVPAATPSSRAYPLHRRELARLCLRKVGGKTVSYQQLQGTGLNKAFPGAQGLRDLQQVETILERQSNTSAVEDLAVFKTARPVTGDVAAGKESAPAAE
jgi:hypothetical protein